MEADQRKRNYVTLQQLHALLDFLKEHPELAKGLTRGRRGKLMTLRVWNECAKKLNAIKGGATRDGKGWSKYWCDWKYRVRRRAMELKAARDGKQLPSEGVTALSAIEETIISLIGENAVDGIIIKSDPLGEGELDEGLEDNDEVPVDHFDNISNGTRSKKRKRRYSKDVTEFEDSGGPSSPTERKMKLNGGFDDTEFDEETSQFLRLEEQKLENSKSLNESVQTIASSLSSLVEIMRDIRDVITNNRLNTM